MTDAERVEVLALAYALLDGSPWYRGGAEHIDGHCVLTAFATAWWQCQGDPSCSGEYAEYEGLRALIRDGIPGPKIRPAVYNDAPGRRKRDVLRLYERAAAKIGK